MSSWFARLREYACIFYYLRNGDVIGDEEQIVEIDEALFVKRKYHHERLLSNQCWNFGGVVRGDYTQCFVEFLPNWSREVLVEVISR